MSKPVDSILLLLIVALALSLILFMLDVFPYPFGLIILSALIFGRMLSLSGPGAKKDS